MSQNALSLKAQEICNIGPVIPVLVIENANDSKPLGDALLAGGVKVLEITLRTPAALDAISASAEIDGAVVGAGTVLTQTDLLNAKAAGATFAVSPGANDDLIAAAIKEDFPLLPGAITPSEVMSLRAKGFHMLKFFPAEIAGGIKMIQAMGSVFSDVSFCPTGGISASNARDYLAQKNIRCVGGSWLAPKDVVADQNWDEITKIAKAASGL
ncbi:MAG: bifunctional 4-hydroxy-2-oxoglutarate aldolase/2-dehydro-3-deoxy-phosphogluconate aldolase [Pseudomonadota bacterium]